MRSIHEFRAASLDLESLLPGVEPLAARQLARDGRRLELAALGGGMRGQVARQSDKDAPPFRSVAPVSKLTGCCFQHLIGVEAGVFTEHGVRQRGQEAPRV